MRLRSGNSLPKMMRPPIDNTSKQYNHQNAVEQLVGSMIEDAIMSAPVRTTSPVVSSTPLAPVPSHEITPLPHPGNTLFNFAIVRPLFGFSMPMNNMDYPYDLPTSMMVGLYTNMPSFSDNAMANVSLYNRKTSRLRPSIIWVNQE